MPTYSGKNARVSVGGNFLCVVKWTINGKVDELDVSCTESGGFAEYKGGVQEADVTLEGFWELNEHDPAFNIMPNVNQAVVIAIDVVNAVGSVWTFPALFISGVTIDAEVRGMVKITITGKGNGLFFYPGGFEPDHTT